MENPDRSYNLSLFLRIWASGFGLLGAPAAMLTGLSIYLLMAALTTLLVSIPMYFLISYLGDGLGNLLFRTRGGPADPEAALKGDVEKARHALRSNKTAEARSFIMPVLEANPDHNEALYVKAQVDMQAGDTIAAKRALRAIVKSADSSDNYRKWARSQLDELIEQRQDTLKT